MNGQLTKGGRTMPVSTMLNPATRRGVILRGTLAVSLTLPLLGAGALRASAATTADAGAAVRAPSMQVAARAPMSPTLPANAACASSAGTASCDVWAKSGTATIAPATTLPVWTFVDSASAGVTAPVGPVLQVTEGDHVHLVLHNQLGSNVSLSIPQVEGFPEDLTGAAPNTTTSYDFVAARPGTYIYEAGGTADGARQVAMGLVGALVVAPINNASSAYGGTDSAFDDQGVIVMSDVDPGLNANPSGYDMRNFSPHFRLYNGVSYPSTAPIPVTAGGTTLLRVVNGGVIQHGISVLGAPVTVFAESSRPVPVAYGVDAENVTAGDTMDLLVKIPADQGLKYAVYDPTMRLDNDGAASSNATGNIVSFGGGLTFLQASGAAPVTNATPVVSSLTVTPTLIGATPTNVSFNATIADDTQVIGAEYVLDNAGAPAGSGNPIAVTPGASVTLTAIPVTLPTNIATGTHQLLVRGQDATGWGAFQSVSFKVDKTGPTIAGITPAAAAVNGSADLAFSGSANDTGGSTVTSVAWSLDGGASAPASISPVTGATSVAFNGSIPAATLVGLADGQHYISAVGTDAVGNVGAAGTAGTPVGAAFLVDKTAPTTGPVTITPNPNDGSQGVAYDPTSVEVRSPYADSGSGVASGEFFIGAAGAPGTGALMTANTATTSLVGLIPLSQLTGLSGDVTISVRAKDKAGNWSTVVTGTLTITQAITVTGLSITPASTSTANTAALAGTASTYAGQTIGAAEYYVDTDPGVGAGSPITLGTPGQSTTLSATIPLAGLKLGQHTVGVRARNSSGSWGGVATTTFTLTHLFGDGFGGALVPPWGSQTTAGSGTLATTGNALNVSVTTASTAETAARAFVATPTITQAVSGYHATFTLTPNTFSTQNRWVSVFRAMSGTGANATERFRVEYRRNGTGTAQVRLVVSTGNGGTGTVPATGQVALNASATTSNTVTVDWSSAPAATSSVSLTVNGATTTRSGVTGLNTSNRTVGVGLLGVSAAPGTAPGNATGNYGGVLILDAFDSSRYAF